MSGLSAQEVSVSFGALKALDEVTLTLEPGRAVMMVGPNGAGKSTLIKVLLGLVRPAAAAFMRDGQAAQINNAWKERTGYLPEAVAFSENLTGLQLLRFFANARGVNRSRVDEVLDRIGLSAASRRRIRGYSRGMRQRLGLGVAILSEPELLVLDEPTAGLDQQGLSVLWAIIAEWREAGRMVLASTHDLALMERRTDELFVLRNGKRIAHGSSEELRSGVELPHRVWMDVSGARTAEIDRLCKAVRERGKGRVERLGDRVLAETPSNQTLELIEIQTGFPGVVQGIRVEEPGLDAVYDKLLEAD